jgi:hypothetical protein
MADLTTAPAAGNQGTTQNPQSAPSGQTISGASAQSGGVQPGTAKDVLTNQNGLSLHTTALTAVSLDQTTSSTGSQAQPAPAVQKPAHHINPALIGISIILIIVAIGLFWMINRSAKSTTN